MKTAVDDRRHDSLEYLAVAISVSDLMSEVSKRVDPDTPIPSVQWLRLQFWPKTPTAKVALQYTGRLKLKYMVQKRQMRSTMKMYITHLLYFVMRKKWLFSSEDLPHL